MTVFLSWSDSPPDPRSRRCRLRHDLNPARRSGQWRVADSPSGGPECCPAAQHQRNDVTSSISTITNSTDIKSLHIEADQANIDVLASAASISVDNTAQTPENMEGGATGRGGAFVGLSWAAWGCVPQLGLGSPVCFPLELWPLSLSVPGRSGAAWCPHGSRRPTWIKVKGKSCSSNELRGTTNVHKDMWSTWSHLSCQTVAGHNAWWGHLRWTPPASAFAALTSCLRGTLRLDVFLCGGKRRRIRTASNQHLC